MATTQQNTTWPEGVIARYLTVAEATIDIRYEDGGLWAKCGGEQCRWQEREWPEVFYHDSDEVRDLKIADALPSLLPPAQAHAEKCRAMPRPTT